MHIGLNAELNRFNMKNHSCIGPQFIFRMKIKIKQETHYNNKNKVYRFYKYGYIRRIGRIQIAISTKIQWISAFKYNKKKIQH